MKKLSLMLLLVIPLLSMSACGFEVVDAGETGIKKTMGKVDPEPLPPGLYTYNPFISNVTAINVQTQRHEGTTPTYTKDVQQASITYVINFNPKPSNVVKLYSEVGKSWAEILIPQVINGEMKNVIGKWNAIDLVANRERASAEIKSGIYTQLEKSGIVVTGFELTNIDYNPEFEKAVEEKVIAVQRAEEAKNKTVQIEEQAKQTIISANADAEAMKIKTEALKESPSLIMYEAALRWDGVLPSVVTSGTGTILDVNSNMFSTK